MAAFLTATKQFRCPQCGDQLSIYFSYTKLIQCRSCRSTIFLEDDAVRLAGKQSVLSQEPSLIALHQPFSYKGTAYLPIGKIRYSYGRGFWEEWWLKSEEGNAYWLSVDEGDMVLEQEVTEHSMTMAFDDLGIGMRLDRWIVTEMGSATCEGFEGTLPKNIAIGNQYDYAHLSGKGALLRTLEFTPQGVEVYEGRWIDPFEIKKVVS